MSKWDKHVTHVFIQVVGRSAEQEQDNPNGGTVPDSNSLQCSVLMDPNPSAPLYDCKSMHWCCCPVHTSPSYLQGCHKGPSKHLAEKCRHARSTALLWYIGLVTLPCCIKTQCTFLFAVSHTPTTRWKSVYDILQLYNISCLTMTSLFSKPRPSKGHKGVKNLVFKPTYQITWSPRLLKWKNVNLIMTTQ